MPLPPNLSVTNWPALTGWQFPVHASDPGYPGTIASAPNTTPVASITKSCFPGGRALAAVIPYAHVNTPVRPPDVFRANISVLPPIPPSVGIQCPTLRSKVTVGTTYGPGTLSRAITTDSGDACLPIITDDLHFPCTDVNATAEVTSSSSITTPSVTVTKTTGTTPGQCSLSLDFNFQFPQIDCPNVQITGGNANLPTVTPSNNGNSNGNLNSSRTDSPLNNCAPHFQLDMNLPACAPQFVPGKVRVIEVNDPLTDGPVGGCMTVTVVGEACERVIQHDVDVRIPARGGGGGSKIGIGIVLGGNAYPISGTLDGTESVDDGDYPDNYLLSLPLPEQGKDGAPYVLPEVVDWSDQKLPRSYKFGDTLPRLPWGLAYVRLARPYVFGSSSWAKAYEKPPKYPTPGQDAVPVATSARLEDSGTTITIKWSKTVLQVGNASTQASHYTLGGTFSGTAPTIKAASVNGDTVTLTLSSSISVDDPPADLGVSIGASAVFSPGKTAKKFNAATSLGVTPNGVRFSIVIALNRAGNQAFQQGALVELDLTGVAVADDLGVARSCPEILAPASSSIPTHTHSSYSGGLEGGGPLFIR